MLSCVSRLRFNLFFLCVKGPVQLISHMAQNFVQKFLRPSNSEGNAQLQKMVNYVDMVYFALRIPSLSVEAGEGWPETGGFEGS